MLLSKYGAARHIYIPIVKRAVVDFAVGADWTPAAGDVKISKDGGAAANVANLPTAIAMGNSAVWDFSLTATEMEAAQIVVTVADAATKAVEDQAFIIETYGHASAQHAFDLDTATVVASSVTAMGADAITAASIAANAIGTSELADAVTTEIADAAAAAVLAGTITELVGVPAASPTLEEALGFLFMALRNKIESTATTLKIHNDAGATIATAGVTDDGTTMSRAEFA